MAHELSGPLTSLTARPRQPSLHELLDSYRLPLADGFHESDRKVFLRREQEHKEEVAVLRGVIGDRDRAIQELGVDLRQADGQLAIQEAALTRCSLFARGYGEHLQIKEDDHRAAVEVWTLADRERKQGVDLAVLRLENAELRNTTATLRSIARRWRDQATNAQGSIHLAAGGCAILGFLGGVAAVVLAGV